MLTFEFIIFPFLHKIEENDDAEVPLGDEIPEADVDVVEMIDDDQKSITPMIEDKFERVESVASYTVESVDRPVGDFLNLNCF